MGSAQRLTERNIWVKCNENHSKGSGDMADKIFKGKSHDLECDLDLESG